jgi:hypothetical protein
MAEPEKYAIIVADIKNNKITNAQYKITDVDAEPKPDTKTGYSPIDITDLATASATAPVTGGPAAVPGAVPITASVTEQSKSENSWPTEIEPATYESIEKLGIFYLVKNGTGEVDEGENIKMFDLLQILSGQSSSKDYKKGIQKLFFRKINITRVATTLFKKATRFATKAYEVANAQSVIPKNFTTYFEIPEKGNIKFSPMTTTSGKPDSLLTVTNINSKELKDSYIIYKAVDNKGFLTIKELIEEDPTITPEDKKEFLESLVEASTSGGAKKSSKKNNLKTKNRRNKLSKRKTLKRTTRKIKRT